MPDIILVLVQATRESPARDGELFLHVIAGDKDLALPNCSGTKHSVRYSSLTPVVPTKVFAGEIAVTRRSSAKKLHLDMLSSRLRSSARATARTSRPGES